MSLITFKKTPRPVEINHKLNFVLVYYEEVWSFVSEIGIMARIGNGIVYSFPMSFRSWTYVDDDQNYFEFDNVPIECVCKKLIFAIDLNSQISLN